ncbi:MAG: hypothetical protein M3Q68_10530, partial [Actinomycetota bacterium]|nr:hypothetical protein [Actinomycetota bacterium]
DDLLEQREFLLRSLRDLDAERAAGDLDEGDFEALRDDYTARAAAVLRLLDEGEATEDEAPAVAAGRRAGRGRLAATVLVLALVSGGAGYVVAGSSGERLATDEASGDIVEGSNDRITRAQVLASEGRILEAVRVYDDLLDDDPENPVALTQRGWLLSRVDATLVDSGLASIERAIALDPGYPDAHFFRGMILWRAKAEPAQAVEAFQRGIDAKPPPDLLATFEEVMGLAQADVTAKGGASAPR